MGTRSVAADRGWGSTWLLFLTLVAIVHVAVVPYQIYTVALDTQPYSLSWLLALAAYLL